LLGRVEKVSSRKSAADDEPKQSAAGWVVGALNGIDCRISDVSLAVSFGSRHSLKVAVGLAHALTVTDGAAGEPEPELNVERLCKEMQLERVRVEFLHSGAKMLAPLVLLRLADALTFRLCACGAVAAA